ncbi:MAG: CBS domain-containing protein [Thermodesulfobacteriota bacterium]
MKVKEIMTSPVIVGKEENTLEEIAHVIIDNKIGCVPIVGKDGRMVGIITETDFMVKERCVPFSRFNAPQLFGKWMPEKGIEQAYKNARELVAKDIMSEGVVSVTEEDGVDEVIKEMLKHDYHHIPVVRDGVPVGIVTRHDILKMTLDKDLV